MIRIIVADDHDLFLEGMTALLNGLPNMEVIGTAKTGNEAIASAKNAEFDLLLMDINMPETNGITALMEIKQDKPLSKIIMLTMHKSREMVQEVIKSGANGYLLKNTPKQELQDALELVHNGTDYFVNEIKDTLVDSFRSSNVQKSIKLTPREKEVLALICDEQTTHEIADQLFLSINTIETHRKNLLSKTGCKNSVGLVKFALKNDLL